MGSWLFRQLRTIQESYGSGRTGETLKINLKCTILLTIQENAVLILYHTVRMKCLSDKFCEDTLVFFQKKENFALTKDQWDMFEVWFQKVAL